VAHAIRDASVKREFVGAVMDVTATKRGEAERRESEARFRIMADTVPVIVWMSGPDMLCTFFNKLWLDFTQRTLEQELGNGWVECVHAEDLEHCLDPYVSGFTAHQPFTMECRLMRYFR
jgi:PAS domain-containing protein